MFVLRAVLALLVLAVLLPALAIFSFTPWAEIPATLLVILAAFALVWRFSWRRERDVAATLRRTSPSRRTLVVVLALGGPAFCIVVDYWLASRYPRYAEGSWLVGPGWDVASAAPFLLLAILLLVTGLGRLAAALAAVALGAIFVLAVWSFATSDSSTAAVALLAPWLYGIPLVGLVFAVDAVARSLLRSRQSHDA
jgi:hypothetical protein